MRGNGVVSTGTFSPITGTSRSASAAATSSDSTRVIIVAVVRERLVELEHRELRIVRPVDAFVAEVVSDFVHALEAAHDQALEIQLVGDAQIERHVERVVVRDEWTRRRAAVQRLQHRRLDFEIAERVEMTRGSCA